MYICVSPNPVSVIRSRWLEGNHLSCPVFECGGSESVWRDKQTTHSLTKREGWKRVWGYSFKIVRYVCVRTVGNVCKSKVCDHPRRWVRFVCTDESPKTRCVYRWVRFVCADKAFGVCVQMSQICVRRWVPSQEGRQKGRKEGRKEGSKQKKQGRHYRKEIYLAWNLKPEALMIFKSYISSSKGTCLGSMMFCAKNLRNSD